jgi:uncharacterized protein (TIGR02466 family)
MNNLVYTFGTPITYSQLAGIEDDKKKLLEFCEDKSNFRLLTSGGNNYMSQDDNIIDSLECTHLKAQILEKIKWYADEVLGIEYEEIVPTQCWLNQYPTGSKHHMHSHPNCYISANLWLKTSENCGNLTFEDPFINFRQIEPNIIKDTGYNNRTMVFEPADDYLIIFPSSVHHMVEENRSAETRISLAVNFWIKGNLGKSESYNLLRL